MIERVLFYKRHGMHINLIDDKLEAYDEKLPLSFNHSLTINGNWTVCPVPQDYL